MSVIFGIFQRNGKPVEAIQLEAMRDAFGPWIADHQSLRVEGPIGIGIRQSFETAQASSFLTPHTDSETGSIYTIECRLDNRDELLRKLNIPNNEQLSIADEKLAFLAYKKWGKLCVHHLLGDWSLCVWNPREQTMFLARDPYGMTAMSYYCDPYIFAFASNKRALLSLPQIPKEPNLLRIAQTFAFWRGDMEQTSHKGIYRLSPAHHLEVGPKLKTKKRYFVLEDSPMLNPASETEASERVLELYRHAVHSTLRHPKGACLSLSGGLDSTSIAALAAEHLAPKGEPLSAFCSIPAYQCPSHGDESPLVQELEQMWPNLAVEYVAKKTANPLDFSFDAIERLAEPVGLTAHYYWFDGFLKMTQERQRGTLLTGDMGNLTLSFGGIPRYLTTSELIKRGHYKLALKKNLTPLKLRQLKAQYELKMHPESFLNTDFMTPTLVEDSQLLQSYKESDWMVQKGIARNSRDIRLNFIAPQHDAIRGLSAERANSYGIDYADPTQELRMMQYCLGLPEQFYLNRSQDRALIRNAMAKHLPQSILSQHKRGNQSLDFFSRLLLCDRDIRERLDQLKQKESVKAYVDLDFLTRQWEQLSKLPPSTHQFSYAPMHFLRGMTCAFFIFLYF